MAINEQNINYITNGEALAAEVLNRPTQDLVDEVNQALSGSTGSAVQETTIIGEGGILQPNIANEFVNSVNASLPSANSVNTGAYLEIFIAEVNYQIAPVITCDGTDTVVGRDGETTDSFTLSGTFSGRIVLISDGIDQWRLLVGSLGGTANNVYIPPDTIGGGAAGTGVWRVLSNNSSLTVGMSFIPDNGAGACTYSLPSTPSDGDAFAFITSETAFSTNTMTLAVTDKNIMGDATELVVDIDGFCGFVVYRASVGEWRVYQDGSAGTVGA